MFIPAFITNAMNGILIVKFPWLSGDVPRLSSHGVYISQLVRIARCCTGVFVLQSKNLQITSKLLTQVTDITSFEKHLESSSGHTLSFFGAMSFQEYVSEGLPSGLLRNSSLQTKEAQMRSEFCLI